MTEHEHHGHDHEPSFTLHARDPLAKYVVRFWADVMEKLIGGAPEPITDARKVADEMEKWGHKHVAMSDKLSAQRVWQKYVSELLRVGRTAQDLYLAIKQSI